MEENKGASKKVSTRRRVPLLKFKLLCVMRGGEGLKKNNNLFLNLLFHEIILIKEFSIRSMLLKRKILQPMFTTWKN